MRRSQLRANEFGLASIPHKRSRSCDENTYHSTKLDETGREVGYYHGVVLDLIITYDGEQIVVDEEEFAILETSP